MYIPDDAAIAEAMRHLEMSDEALFEDLARTDAEHAFLEGSAFENGRRRYRVIRANMKNAICRDEMVRSIFAAEGQNNRRLMLLCAIADLIHTAGAMAVAALVLREGLETYCTDMWGEKAHA
jgi:hypothetical protein